MIKKTAEKKDKKEKKDDGSKDPGKDLTKALHLVRKMVAEGENPPTYPGSAQWDESKLAIWYGRCRTLSIYLGKDNPYESQLTSFDPVKIKIGDPAFHRAMLGTLIAIQEYLEEQPTAGNRSASSK